jgi:hypothetical protein
MADRGTGVVMFYTYTQVMETTQTENATGIDVFCWRCEE